MNKNVRQFTIVQALTALSITLFLLTFLLVPVLNVVYIAFADGNGSLTLSHFGAFFGISLMQESFWNSLIVALASVFFASIIALPLAYLTIRFEFRGALLIQTLGVLPLIMPPFVGAVAMQLIFGRSGSVNLLLNDWFGIAIPMMEGLTGVIFVESLHYFPFILLNLVLSCIAALQAPVIMMSQNRQGEKDRLDAHLDYEVNVRAELQILALHEKLDLARDQQLSRILALVEQQAERLAAIERRLAIDEGR